MPIDYLRKIQLGEFNACGYRVCPSKSVESVIEGFYVFSKDKGHDTDLIFNDGFPVLVFLQNIDDAVSVTADSGTSKITAAWASAGPVRNVRVKYDSGTAQIFIVRFHPGAFYRLFGLSAQHFRNNPVSPFENIARDNNFNIAEFYQSKSINEKIEFIQRYIRNHFTKVDTPEILHKILNYIHRQKGRSTVQHVVNDAGINYKRLERSFTQYVGLLPKEYIQLQRFIHAYVDLVGSEDVNLMEVAVSNGYYDSNHFLKDFKSYTGKTPLQYLKMQG